MSRTWRDVAMDRKIKQLLVESFVQRTSTWLGKSTSKLAMDEIQDMASITVEDEPFPGPVREIVRKLTDAVTSSSVGSAVRTFREWRTGGHETQNS